MVDLHLHSTFSDGSRTPEEVVALAREAGLSAAVLTDHDNWRGADRFRAAADAAGLRTAVGMEISADVPGRTVHLLAYGFDPADEDSTACWLSTAPVPDGVARVCDYCRAMTAPG